MDDFVPLTDEPLTIPSISPLRQDICFNININGDVEQEDNESFTVTVTTANSTDIIDGLNMAIVTILDDGMLSTFHDRITSLPCTDIYLIKFQL